MIELCEHHPLIDCNTLRVPARARYYIALRDAATVAEASDFARQRQLPLLALGGGSNIVLRGDYPGLVAQLCSRGVTGDSRGDDDVLVTAAAGESWHALVAHCLQRQWYGLENLTLIPGSVGAAPIQNIGAYGVELSERLVSVEGWDREDRRQRTLSCRDCEFGYRDSIFKRQLKDRFIITAVTLRLSRRAQINTSYPAVREALPRDCELTPAVVEATIRGIRQSKLPDPAEQPNVGSFFKNPVLAQSAYRQLSARFSGLPGYPQPDGRVKIPAAWLIEQAGWKGRQRDGVQVCATQPLVLINRGADGSAVLAMAAAIQADIARQFGIELQIEPQIY